VSFGRNIALAHHLYDDVPGSRFSNLSDAHAKMIKRVAEEGDSPFWGNNAWDSDTYSIFTHFPEIEEFLITAPGFGLGENEDGARALEAKGTGAAPTDATVRWENFMDGVEQERKQHQCGAPYIRIVSNGWWKGGADSPKFSMERDKAETKISTLKHWITSNLAEWCSRS